MGVPALFRWLSRKYPKIVLPVIEDEPTIIPGADGEEPTEVPVDIRKPNPNGSENDCLYLDMNGIVHPCTHPEGKPAPKTEEDMMMEVFKYTERVVNMARPRKVLLMAIDGVAPRAKMNQQRSRRFRAADEAKKKAEEREEVIAEWEAMGKELSDEFKNEKAWDSNAITPGTPFMDLLAAALRYWVAYKMNTDPGWANLQVIISDASVPGEGEHKIMDFVRRQRSQPGYDPNTTHVFYGLDADLIMLSLATHEPNFKILREDVFAQANKRGCHKCGEPGHHSRDCNATPAALKAKAEEAAKAGKLKPFIFLDVSILREYLQIELDVPGLPFAFDVERAIDDWVFMIFFVGNDFLPHLPSLDIREGAIDMLLKIWRSALPQMGGYLTNNGSVDLKAAQVIMSGLADREDDIFRKRKQNEEREEAQAQEKRRRIEIADARRNGGNATQSQSEQHSFRNGIDYVPVIKETQPAQPAASAATESAVSAKASVIATPKPKNPMFVTSRPVNASIRGGFIHSASNQAAASTNGSDMNKDLVANRAAIRKANLSAADMLRAELAAGKGDKKEVEPAAAETAEPATDAVVAALPPSEEETERKSDTAVKSEADSAIEAGATQSLAVEPDGTEDVLISTPPVVPESVEEDVPKAAVDGTGVAAIVSEDQPMAGDEQSPRGKKRSADEAGIPASRSQAEIEDSKEADSAANGDEPSPSSSSSDNEDDDDDADAGNVSVLPAQAHVPKPLKHLGGNMVEQEDTVQLWEPGYKERYYQQKFNVGIEDANFRRSCAHAYVEGLCWVLAYYYKGCPSWTWYYPHHFAPFASDFTDLETMDIKFEEGKPFRPFEQLMGVFPAASRKHIPEAFQGLMIEEDSEIIDFYPEEFHIDMNGKKMLWQGVALLPFIDQTRLLDALAKKYPLLTDDENRRNGFGTDTIFVQEENPLYNQICSLYMKRKVDEPMPVDASLSRGIRATILPNSDCIPNSTYTNPLTSLPLSDLHNDRSISATWFMPPQLSPHKSVLLPGYKPVRRVLTPEDITGIHDGINGNDGNRHRRGPAGDGFHAQRRNYGDGPGFNSRPRGDARSAQDPRRASGGYSNGRNDNGYGTERNYGGHAAYGAGGSSYRPSQPMQPAPYGGYGSQQDAYRGYGQNGHGQGGYGGPSNGAGYGGYGASAPPPAPYAPPQQSSYGGYGGAKHASYAPLPPAYASTYGGYGQSYGAPAPPPAAAPAPYGGYGSYGSYGQAPPPQQQGYRPPVQPQYTNRGPIVPSHLPGQQSQHQRWNR